MAFGLTWWQLALMIWGVLSVPAAVLVFALCRAAADGDAVLADQEASWAENPPGDNWPRIHPSQIRDLTLDDRGRLTGTVTGIDRALLEDAGATLRAKVAADLDERLSGRAASPAGDAPWTRPFDGWLGLTDLPVQTTPHAPRGTVMVLHPDELERMTQAVLDRPPSPDLSGWRASEAVWEPRPRDLRPGRCAGWRPAGTYTGDPRTGYRPAWARMATLLDRIR